MGAPAIITPPPQTLLALANSWSAKQTFSAGASIASGQALDWNSDLFLQRGGANVLQQRNGANAQASQIFNTFTDASNGEWGSIGWLGNVFTLTAAANGTGTARTIQIIQGGAARMTFNGTGISVGASLVMSGARYVQMAASTVASLPSATGIAGARMFATDALSPTFGATVVGGGAVPTPVYSDGTTWKVG